MLMYCLKCKAKKECDDVKKSVSKNGRNMLRGVCKTCGTKTCQFTK